MRKIFLLLISLLASLALKAQNIPYEKLDSISVAISKYQLKASNLAYNDGQNNYQLSFPDKNFVLFYGSKLATRVVNRKVEENEFVSITEKIDLSKVNELYQVQYPGIVGVLRMNFPDAITTQVYTNGVYTTSFVNNYVDFFWDKKDKNALGLILSQLRGMFNLLGLQLKIPTVQTLLKKPANSEKLDSFSFKAETVDDVINKCIAAFGGADKIQSIRTVVVEGIIKNQGMDIPTKIWFQTNQGMRMDMEIQGKVNKTVVTTNGSWTLFPAQKQKRPVDADATTAKEAAEELDLTGDLFDYKTKGNKVELMGKETVNGKSVYKIKVMRKSGSVVNLLLDTDTFFPIQRIINKTVQGNITKITEHIGDYKRTVDGHVYASSYQYLPSGMSLRYSKYEVNAPIGPKTFDKP